MRNAKPYIAFRSIGAILFCALPALGGPGALIGLGASQQAGNAPAVAIRYVATYGSDAGSNDCLTQATPCLTIGHAISQAAIGDTLRIAEGTYLETVDIDRPVHLEGGYQANTWNRDVALYETIIDASNSRDVPGDWDGDVIMDPAVIAVPGGYRMAYTGGNDFYPWGVGMADSPDGVTWIKYAGNPVLTPAGGSAWDNLRRSRVTLLLDGGVYKMWYDGRGGPRQIGYATSPDGYSWNIYGTAPVLPVGLAGSWDASLVTDPNVLLDNGVYKMWYRGCNATTCSIGYATSPDGIAWTKFFSNPVLTATTGAWDEISVSVPRVIKRGSSYEMWYISNNGKVGLATSGDGVSWSKYAGNPVIPDWEGREIGPTSVLFDGSLYRMWVSSPGVDDIPRIGLATSSDGITWTMHPSSPVLTTGVPSKISRSAVRINNNASGSSLDGLTITGAQSCNDNAGGVSITDAVVTITHSKIRDNVGQWCNGGGIGVVGSQADLTLQYTQVYSNTAGNAGGIAVMDGANMSMDYSQVTDNQADCPDFSCGNGGGIVVNNGSSMTIEDSLIQGNTATQWGGGINADKFSSLIIRRTTIQGNHADHSAGGIITAFGDSELEDVQVLGNSAVDGGGGIYPDNAGLMTIRRGLIQGNTSGDTGGGINLGGETNLYMYETRILDNIAGGDGGAIAGQDPRTNSQLYIENSLIAGNQSAGWGGGISLFRGTLVNATITANTCTKAYCSGVNFEQDDSNHPKVLVNTIVSGNSPGNFYCVGDCQVSYSNIQGGFPGTGNFDLNPQFINPGVGDYRLVSNSPCIDSGTSSQAPIVDLEGDPRPLNAGYDVGADEYGTPYGSGPVVLRLEPTGVTQYVGQPFQVQLQVVAGSQPVDGASAFLNFDPSIFQVKGITPGVALPMVLQNSYDNNTGRLDFSAGALSNYPSGTFTLATITFNPLAVASSAPIGFHTLLPRRSNATYGGASVLQHVELGRYKIRDDAIIDGAVGLQGRPAAPDAHWITPLTVKLTPAGQATPVYVLNPTTDDSGQFTLEGIVPGDYDIVVKNSHTLANTKIATLALGPNLLSFGTLREGDANDDNCVLMVDFSILATTFGKQQGMPGYDDRADFDEDTFITITDFSLLAMNFGVCGNLPALAALNRPTRSALQPGVDVMILIQPAAQTVLEGQPATISLVVQSGSQLVDGVQAHLNFDPNVLHVTKITGNSGLFPAVLKNQYDNNAGTVDYAAGTFSGFPSGTITVATVEFQTLHETPLTALDFQFNAPRLTDVTYGGFSVLTQHQDGSLTIILAPFKNYLPLIAK